MAKTDSPGAPKLDSIGQVGPVAYVLWSDVSGIRGCSFVNSGADLVYYTEVLLRGGGSVSSPEQSSRAVRDQELERLLGEWRRYLSESA